MSFCVRHLQIIWLAAFLLMAGGQVAHAYMDLKCSKDGLVESQQSPVTDDDCPLGNCCCHCHLHTKLAVVDSAGTLIPDTSARSFVNSDVTALEGPSREIEYPPQLS